MNIKYKQLNLKENGDFWFEFSEKDLSKLFEKEFPVVRGFLFKKNKDDCFQVGFCSGYDQGYNDAFSYLLNELGVDRNSGKLLETTKRMKELKDNVRDSEESYGV